MFSFWKRKRQPPEEPLASEWTVWIEGEEVGTVVATDSTFARMFAISEFGIDEELVVWLDVRKVHNHVR